MKGEEKTGWYLPCLEEQSDKNVKKWNNEKYKQNVVQLGQYIGQLSQYKQNMSNRRPWG